MLAIYSYLTFILFLLLFVLPSQNVGIFSIFFLLFFPILVRVYFGIVYFLFVYNVLFCLLYKEHLIHFIFLSLFFSPIFFSLCRRCASVYFLPVNAITFQVFAKQFQTFYKQTVVHITCTQFFFSVWILCRIDKVETRV